MAFRQISDELNQLVLKGAVKVQGRLLGRGAYGKVFAVKYQDLPCAAKEIHPLLLDGVSPAEKKMVKESFLRECYQSSLIHHPNIVQIIGVYYPSKMSELPNMVMELLDANVSSFVEENKSNIAVETKMSILHDVSLGLSYLHARDPPMVHRDLSSNNVLLTKDRVAKISDLGMAKMIRTDSKQTRSRLTTAPGTLHFMPPEALVEDDPIYGTPVDVFSFAGIALHLFSEEWPTPTGVKIRDPKTKKIFFLTEIERRQQYLDKMVGRAAILKETVTRCLNDDPDLRPLIEEVSEKIEPLKTNHSGIQKLTDQFQGASVTSTSPAKPTKELPSFAEALQSNQYHIKWTTCANLPVKLYSASVTSSAGGDVYVTAGGAPVDSTYYKVYHYQTTSKKWNILPKPGHGCGVLQMLDGKLNIFGGCDSVTRKYHNKVTTYNHATNTWYKCYPDMLNNRFKPGVITYRDHVIAIGGASSSNSFHDSIEVMNYHHHLQWREVSVHLPAPMWRIKPTISGEDILIVGYTGDVGRYLSSYKIAADDIISTPDQLLLTAEVDTWTGFKPAPHYDTASVPYSSPAVIIGGDDIKGDSVSDISLYDASKKLWIKVGTLTSARKHVGIGLLNSTTVIIIGGTSGGLGYEANKASSLTTVEIGEIVLTKQ